MALCRFRPRRIGVVVGHIQTFFWTDADTLSACDAFKPVNLPIFLVSRDEERTRRAFFGTDATENTAVDPVLNGAARCCIMRPCFYRIH